MTANHGRFRWRSKGALPLQLIGRYLLVFIGLAVAIGLFVTLFNDPKGDPIDDAAKDSLQTEGTAVCHNFGFQEYVNARDLQRLLLAHQSGSCNSAQTTVRLDFTLTKGQLKEILSQVSITNNGEPYMLFRQACDMPTGYGGVAVKANDSTVVYQRHTPVTLSEAEQGVVLCDFTPKGVGEMCEQDSMCKEDLICDYRNATAIASCSNNVAAAQFNTSLIALGDSSPLLQCCSRAVEQLFVNIAKALSGTNIHVVYETAWQNDTFDPNFSRFAPLQSALAVNGFSVDKQRHVADNRITASTLSNVSQLWLIQPGWCQGMTRTGSPRTQQTYCDNVTGWSQSEIQAIRSFINANGSVLLTSSYAQTNGTEHMDQETPNAILSAVHDTAQFATDGCYCGCDETVTSQVHTVPVTQGVTELSLEGAAAIDLSRICQSP